MKVLLILVKFFLAILVTLTPLIGVWLATSLSIYLNGPMWVAVAAGAILFPLGPLLWEAWASHRFTKAQKKREEGNKDPKKKGLKFSDRLILRTLMLNLLFVGGLLLTFPTQSFEALNTRGDWMLQEQSGGNYDLIRDLAFGGANGLEWLYDLTRENPYEKYTPEDQGTEKPKPNKQSIPSAEVQKERAKEKEPEKRKFGEAPLWPMKAELHPLVNSITKSDELSIESVAKYIAANEKDPFLRVKALNDYVADRIAYDGVALAEGRYPPQDAQSVFTTKMGVCAGYAKLLVALSKYSGDHIIYVGGVSRDQNGGIPGSGHAWNAVEIEGGWYLIDPTWNSGYLEGSKFIKSYKTDHLFTPPKAFGVDHYPDEKQWQLRKDPITRGEFARQPMLRAGFFAKGLELISPRRSQVSIEGPTFVVELKNPLDLKLLTRITPKGGGNSERCKIEYGTKVQIKCLVPSKGTYQIEMFATRKGSSFPFVGELEVVR